MAKTELGPPPVEWLDADFGDAGLTVREFPDGMFAVDLDDTRLVVNAAQMQTIVQGMNHLGRMKGWI